MFIAADLDVEVTADALKPLLEEVVEIIEWAIKAVKALLGLDVNSILKTVTGLLDLSGLAQLLCDVLTVYMLSLILQGLSLIGFMKQVVLKLIQLVLKLVSLVVKDEILPLLCKILDLVAELLSCILGLSIVGDVLKLVILVVKLVDRVLLDIICDLGVESLIKLLGL